MAKGIKSKTRSAMIANGASLESGSNKIFTEVDMGMSRNATILVAFTLSSTEYMEDFHVASSKATGTPATGTEVASDNNTIVQDTVNSQATTTITSKACDISSTGLYVYNVQNIRRFLNVQYTGTGTGSSATIVILGLDLEGAPHSTATTAY